MFGALHSKLFLKASSEDTEWMKLLLLMSCFHYAACVDTVLWQVFTHVLNFHKPTSLHTAAIWASSMHVSVTTSVREPPARYSITTKSSSPTRKLKKKMHAHSQRSQFIVAAVHVFYVYLYSNYQVSYTCLQNWQCWGSSAPSWPGSRWWLTLSSAASASWSVW